MKTCSQILGTAIATRRARGALFLAGLILTPAVAESQAAEPGSPLASLRIYSEPPGAAVYLDDAFLGETDAISGALVTNGLAPREHVLRLTRRGYADVTQSLTLVASTPTTVQITLAPLSANTAVPPWLLGLTVVALFACSIVAVRMRRQRSASMPHDARLGLAHEPRAANPRTLRGTPSERLAELGSQVLEAAKTGGASERPERFGDYLLLEQLGQGGMASVFKAERGGELSALKRPLDAHLEDGDFRKRFEREAEIGHTLQHPNIVRILEQGAVGNVPFFTMELLRGETLQARLRHEGVLSPHAAAELVAQVAEALGYAHRKGVIHRDVKPSNIMVGDDGTAKVMDYGIARARRFEALTLAGSFLGTPDYVAPETAEGRGSDARSDLYSLGIVLYEILTGRKPFVGATAFATLRKHVAEPPVPPSTHAPATPAALEAIVLRLLRKNPEERYASAAELLVDLRAFLKELA
jgi:hypothetical protein